MTVRRDVHLSQPRRCDGDRRARAFQRPRRIWSISSAAGELDGNDLDDDVGNSPLIARTGAHIGDVLPGEERHVEIAYSVAGAIENGTIVELQAARRFVRARAGRFERRAIGRAQPSAASQRVDPDRDRASLRSGARVPRRWSRCEFITPGESSAHDVVVGRTDSRARRLRSRIGARQRARVRARARLRVRPHLRAGRGADAARRSVGDARLPDTHRQAAGQRVADRRRARRSRRKRRPASRSSRAR